MGKESGGRGGEKESVETKERLGKGKGRIQ